MSSSEDEDDWVLRQIHPDHMEHPQKSPHAENPEILRPLQPSNTSIQNPPSPPPPKLVPSTNPDSPDSDIEIPGIFLMQGEKNRQLLRQNDEIQRQIDAENSKELARANQVLNLQSQFLQELNDNGVGYEYTMSHDMHYVQDLIDLYLRQDPELGLRRHFYFFSAPIVPNPAPQCDMLEYLGKSEPKLEMSCILHMVSASAQISHLDKVHAAILSGGLSGGDLGRPLCDYMAALGGADPAQCRLKLAHYNDNLSQVIYKASIVLLLGLSRCSRPDEYREIARYFYLASSDFLLNKHQRERLCAVLIGPVLARYVSGMVSQSNVQRVAQEFHEMVEQIRLVTCGPEVAVCAGHKEAEMYHNFLENAMGSNLGLIEHEFVEALSLRFMEIDGTSMTLKGLITRIEKMCTPDFSAPETIYKGVFQIQLAAAYIQRLVYGSVDGEAGDVLICRRALLESKDLLQNAVGNFSYVQSEQKVQISRSLAKTYHTLDSITRVLDKMAVFLGTDHFYNEDSQR